jgi:hypothetical protein
MPQVPALFIPRVPAVLALEVVVAEAEMVAVQMAVPGK